jgi:hypothetical protein
MTAAVKTPKPFLPVRKPKSGTEAPATGTVSASKGKSSAAASFLVVGGEPRVHLLPGEVISRKRAKVLKKRLGFGVVAVVLLVGAGFGFASLTLGAAQANLISVQSQTASLLQQQAKYGRVPKIKADTASIVAAQKTATAQEILWQPYIVDLQSTLPADGAITAVTTSIDAPFLPALPITDPLQGPRIATIVPTLSMSQSEISPWLATLPNLKGFVDATPNSVTLDPTTGLYFVVVTIHVNNDALSNRFSKAAGTSK